MTYPPGPWEVSENYVFINDDHNVPIVVVGERSEKRDVACLIAAAPEMLAELRDCLCPRPTAFAQDHLTVEQCIARGECGCSIGAAVKKATRAA